MEIRINIGDRYCTTVTKFVNNIEEVKDVLKDEFATFGMTAFNYCWKEDGRSLIVFDDEEIVSECNDVNDVVEMMAERIGQFGNAMVWSIVFDEEKGYGTQYEIYVYDMDNAFYRNLIGADKEDADESEENDEDGKV